MSTLNSVEIDQSEVVEELPPGDYKVCVADVEQKTSKAGNPYLRWQLTVVDHVEPKYNSKAIWHSTPTTGKGAFRLTQFIKAAQGTRLDKSATSFNPQNLMGKTILATVVPSLDQEGNPNGFSEIKSVRSVA
jgi:hypothetical protein